MMSRVLASTLPLVGVACFAVSFCSSFNAPAPAGSGERIPVLILTGESRTDWRWTSTHLRGLLEDSGKFDVEISAAPEGALSDPMYLERFDLFLIDYAGFRWGELAEANFMKAVEQGTGVVAIADSVAAFEGWEEYEELIGFRCSADAYLMNLQPVKLSFTEDEHPIASGYGGLGERQAQLAVGLELVAEEEHQVIATVAPVGGGASQPALVVGKHGEGRVFATPLGHVAPERMDTWAAQRSPSAEQLFLRACEWAATGEVTGLRRLAPNTLTDADRAQGWELLFDGNSAKGWGDVQGRGFPAERWSAEDGVLRVLPAEDSSGFSSVQEFREFELELEWSVEGEGGSVLNLLGAASDVANMQLADTANDYAAGEDSAMHVLRPIGEFNHARVVATYDSVEHWLNGFRIATIYNDPAQWAQRVTAGNLEHDAELNQMPLGRISLEGAGVGISYRNIKIRRLPLPVAEQAPAEPTLIELFNGRDLEGWSWLAEQPIRNERGGYFVRESGILSGSGMPLGQLRTNEVYANFELSLDWRSDPQTRQAGEGGVLLRSIGADALFPDALEVKLDANKAGSLRRYQSFAATYDKRRRSGDNCRQIRNVEHRAGEWNRLEVRLDRGELLVRVNGEVVNAASGLSQRAGQVAVIARRSMMQFRNLQLRPLD